MSPRTHRDRAVELLAKAEPLPLASSQRLAILAEAQVHASLAFVEAYSASPAPATKAAPRKTRKPAEKPAQEESAPNAE